MSAQGGLTLNISLVHTNMFIQDNTNVLNILYNVQKQRSTLIQSLTSSFNFYIFLAFLDTKYEIVYEHLINRP